MTARPLDFDPPPAATWIVRTLEKAGFETWAVGGAIRDTLAGIRSDDWDFATRALPGEVQRVFPRTVPIGVDHGTVGVLATDGTLYEVTTFRLDVETTGRHATVRFAKTLEEDLARRDFTINAIAWHPLRRELRDPFGGGKDLLLKVLRTVGDPRLRFREDYLRVLRALRFAGSFELRIEEETWTAIRAATGELGILSPERVREELLKVLTSSVPSSALDLYAESGVLAALYPVLEEKRARDEEGEREWHRALEVVDRLSAGRALLRLSQLLRSIGVPAALALLERLRFSNAAIGEVGETVAAAPPGRVLLLPDTDAPAADVRRWLSRVGPGRVPDLTRLSVAAVRAEADAGRAEEAEGLGAELVQRWRRVRDELRASPALTVDALAIDGRDLIRMGLKPGPDFGRILDRLLEEVIEDPELNTLEGLSGRVKEYLEAP
jgi:tRNA nucleotidyltransferase (CCA-adding enzyme)